MKTLMAQAEPPKSLVRRAREGDRVAFDALAQGFRERLVILLRSRIRPHIRQQIDMDDIVQETFARAFQSVARFQGDDADDFRAWLTGIGKKVVLKAIEKLGRVEPLRLERDVPSEATSPSRGMRREERFERLERSIRGLSADHQEVVNLARIEGLSLEEVSRRLGRSPVAVKKLLWRALKELRAVFGDTESCHLPPRSLRVRDDSHGDRT